MSPPATPTPGNGEHPWRWVIIALIFLGTVVNFLDRLAIPVLSPVLQAEFHLTNVQYSWIGSAFLFAYAASMFVWGAVNDTNAVRVLTGGVAFPPPNGAPYAASGLVATLSNNTNVILSWTAGSGATSYNLYRAAESGGEPTNPVVTGITGTTYTDTNLNSGTTYYFQVVAVNGSGLSGYSPEAHATTTGVKQDNHQRQWQVCHDLAAAGKRGYVARVDPSSQPMMIRRYFILCGALIGFGAGAQTVTNVIDRFDPAGIGANTYASGKITNVWANWFGSAFQSLSWDTSFALNHPNSGVTITPNGGTFNIAAGITLTVSNPIAGEGTLASIGGGTLVLAASNTATGNLIVSNSTLALAGSAALNNYLLGISNNATLDVTALTVPLAISNKIALAGNLRVKVNSTGTSSKLTASNLVYGGTLTISNTGPGFAAGNTFSFFTASNYSGGFTSISPATPGSGLAWDTSKLAVNGTIQVSTPPAVSVIPVSTNIFYGTSTVLNANATGTPPLSYQWYDNHTNAILWGTNATLTLTNPAVTGSGNYTVTVMNTVGLATNFAAITISQATLTVTANSTNRPVGAPNPVFTVSYTGWMNTDTFLSALTGNPTWSTTATTSSPVGSYAIVITNGTLSATNYTFVFVNGTLTITPARYPTNLTFSVNGTTLNLNWPATHLGWTLQTQTNAPAAGLGNNWTDIANSATTNQVDILISPAIGSGFYRLRQ